MNSARLGASGSSRRSSSSWRSRVPHLPACLSYLLFSPPWAQRVARRSTPPKVNFWIALSLCPPYDGLVLVIMDFRQKGTHMTIKVDRGVRLAAAPSAARRSTTNGGGVREQRIRHPADQAVAVLVALIGLATALSKSEFIGRVISTFDADWRYPGKDGSSAATVASMNAQKLQELAAELAACRTKVYRQG